MHIPKIWLQRRGKKQDEYQYNAPVNPPDKQSQLRYNAKMAIFLFVGLFPIMLWVTGSFFFIDKIWKNNSFSTDTFVLAIFLSSYIPLSLVMIFWYIYGYYSEKCLPRYSAKGTVVSTRTVWRGHGRTYYCFLTIRLEMNVLKHTNFYAPQKIYDAVCERDSVNLVYHHFSSECHIIDNLIFAR